MLPVTIAWRKFSRYGYGVCGYLGDRGWGVGNLSAEERGGNGRLRAGHLRYRLQRLALQRFPTNPPVRVDRGRRGLHQHHQSVLSFTAFSLFLV